MYDLYEKEANLALANGLVLPAHDYILKCSHTFNILDTRGAVGVTERQALFSRMRDLSHRTAELYLSQRESLGFPWLKKESAPNTTIYSGVAIMKNHRLANNRPEKNPCWLKSAQKNCQPAILSSAIEQLTKAAPAMLDELRLEHSEIKIFATPRRLVIYAEKVVSQQADSLQVIKGPPVSRGLDASGKPTPAAEGFARGKGIPVEELIRKTLEGGDYLVAELQLKGRSTEEVLAEELPKLIGGIHFDKAMRWNSSNMAFSRPIRWLLALIGSQVIPFEYAGIISGNRTRGLRFHDPEESLIPKVEDYFAFLEKQGIQLDPQLRMKSITSQVSSLQKSVSADIMMDASSTGRGEQPG